MRSVEKRREREYEGARTFDDVSALQRPSLSRGRRLESFVDMMQLIGEAIEQRDDEPFTFMFGYSVLGGPDELS